MRDKQRAQRLEEPCNVGHRSLFYFISTFYWLGKNPTEEELLGLVMEVDIDGNGTIEFGEFIDLMRHNSLDVLDEEADLRMAFKMFDSNGEN